MEDGNNDCDDDGNEKDDEEDGMDGCAMPVPGMERCATDDA